MATSRLVARRVLGRRADEVRADLDDLVGGDVLGDVLREVPGHRTRYPRGLRLNRRRVVIEHSSSSLKIYGEKSTTGFWARLFGLNSSERVTLKLPRQIALLAKGINGSVVAGDVEGSLEVRGINGRVQVGTASGSVDLKGINGNVVLALKQLNLDAVSLSGINGNIELRVADGVNGYLDVKGINGRLVSEASQVTIKRENEVVIGHRSGQAVIQSLQRVSTEIFV